MSKSRQVIAGQQDAATLGAKMLLYIGRVGVTALRAFEVGQVSGFSHQVPLMALYRPSHRPTHPTGRRPFLPVSLPPLYRQVPRRNAAPGGCRPAPKAAWTCDFVEEDGRPTPKSASA